MKRLVEGLRLEQKLLLQTNLGKDRKDVREAKEQETASSSPSCGLEHNEENDYLSAKQGM